MSTKQHVLEILEKNRDKNVSGEYIADLFSISRNMVWRAVKDLRCDGYTIEAVTNKGYRLVGDNDIISAEGIKPFLFSPAISENIKIYSQIDSTNREAKTQAVNKASHGTVIISDRQTSGKGRHNRDFFSPSGSGLYMSLILYSDSINFGGSGCIDEQFVITAFAAICVCEAIENVCGVKPSIKPINDIYLNGKKIAGILTEAIMEFEERTISEIILGIGINVSTKQQDFPDDIKNRAGSIYPSDKPSVSRNRLAAEIINRVLSPYMTDTAEILEKYNKRLQPNP